MGRDDEAVATLLRGAGYDVRTGARAHDVQDADAVVRTESVIGLSPQELLLRVGLDCRRGRRAERLDSAVALASAAGLTTTQRRLLAALAGGPGRAVPRKELVRAVWPTGPASPNTLDCAIRRLRQTFCRRPRRPGLDARIPGG